MHGSHAVDDTLPVEGFDVPAAHCVHDELPLAAYVPVPHCSHTEALVAPTVVLAVPAAHASHVELSDDT